MNAPMTIPTAIMPAVSTRVRPGALADVLDDFPQVRVLSLDCFDTLLWRDCHAPADIFAALPDTTPAQRIRAESRARAVARLERGSGEVSIEEIYAELLPNADPEERAAAIAAELEAEAHHCFAFAQTVALMLAAKDRGLEVIIVSDTYLDEAQLRALIAASAGEDVAALVDRIFCSSTHDCSKGDGLYRHVQAALGRPGVDVLHIGDNAIADVAGVRPFGVNTVHLAQFTASAREGLRLEASAGAMLAPRQPCAIAAPQPHRAALALAAPALDDPAQALGMASLGPVFAGFELWLQREAEQLAELHGGSVHWLFLMRDGHLPLRMHEASGHAAPAHAVEISRFTATAASFASEQAITDYLARELGTRPETLARQLLVDEARIASLCSARDPQAASKALWRDMRSKPALRRTLRASRAFATRLVEHVRATVRPEEGDVLMLVDLGYNGTVQNRIDALLAEDLGVHVAGRYLLLREMDRPGLDKAGFIDTRHFDAHALEALCANVAVIEQAATKAVGSVVDYTADGTPIRRENDIKGAQSDTREALQEGCLTFQRALAGSALRTGDRDILAHWRQGAAATLARLMFLPRAEELAVFEAFEHDVNLGTERTVPLFDRALGAKGLRRRGLFYMKGSQRMYLPAELQGQGMAPRLALLASKRFALPLTFTDFADRSLDLPVIYADQDTTTQGSVTAQATHDGFYMAAIPVGACRFSVAVQFGQACDWFQLESAEFVPASDLLSETAEELREEIAAAGQAEGLEEVTPGLWRCRDDRGFMLFHPPDAADEGNFVLAVTFRPLTR